MRSLDETACGEDEGVDEAEVVRVVTMIDIYIRDKGRGDKEVASAVGESLT